MRMSEAMLLMAAGRKGKSHVPVGYRIGFDRVQGQMLNGGHFPDRDEPMIPSAEYAAHLAEMFAEFAPEQFVNIRVLDDQFNPIKDGGQLQRVHRLRT